LEKYLKKGKTFLASIIDDQPTISVINKIEVLGFSIVSEGIIELVNSSTVISLTDEIINQPSLCEGAQNKITRRYCVQLHLYLILRWSPEMSPI